METKFVVQLTKEDIDKIIGDNPEESPIYLHVKKKVITDLALKITGDQIKKLDIEHFIYAVVDKKIKDEVYKNISNWKSHNIDEKWIGHELSNGISTGSYELKKAIFEMLQKDEDLNKNIETIVDKCKEEYINFEVKRRMKIKIDKVMKGDI